MRPARSRKVGWSTAPCAAWSASPTIGFSQAVFGPDVGPLRSGRRPGSSPSPGQRPGDCAEPIIVCRPNGPMLRRGNGWPVGPLRNSACGLRSPGRCPGLGEPRPRWGRPREQTGTRTETTGLTQNRRLSSTHVYKQPSKNRHRLSEPRPHWRTRMLAPENKTSKVCGGRLRGRRNLPLNFPGIRWFLRSPKKRLTPWNATLPASTVATRSRADR